ncbi:MAG: alpha/beta hydrolase-fold protein [Myxococcota bacterium]
MNPALETLLRDGPPDGARINDFLSSTTFPMVDESGVTLVFRGHADAVFLRCWISGLEAAQRLHRVDGTDLWAAHIELPPGSRVEYKLEVERGGRKELVLDPLNPVTADDPFGANSVLRSHGYERPAWSLRNPDARQGTIEIHKLPSTTFGDTRELQVYLPARFRRNRQYPLLIVHDGIDYMRFASFQDVLDNLIYSLEVRPLIVALTQSPDRLNEYAANDRHAAYVMDEILPFMREGYPLVDEPQARGLMGASFGAVASLHTAWRNPGVFDRLLLQSGSFAFSDIGRHKRSPVFDPVARFTNAFRAKPGRPSERMYLSCGIYESLIYENRSLVPKLQSQGIDVRFEEARDAHNWENWRDRLRNGLSWLFPGRVWLVYE